MTQQTRINQKQQLLRSEQQGHGNEIHKIKTKYKIPDKCKQIAVKKENLDRIRITLTQRQNEIMSTISYS